MNTIYKWSSRVFLVMFIGVLIPLINLILNFREKIGREVNKCSQAVLSRLDNEFMFLYSGLAVLILSALLAILFILLYNRNNAEGQSVVYIDRDRSIESAQNRQRDDGSENMSQQTNLAVRLDKYKSELLALKASEHSSIDWLEKGFSLLCKHTDALQGALFILDTKQIEPVLEMKATFAYFTVETQPPVYSLGEGLVGQAAKQKQALIIKHVPQGHIKVISGLGSANPSFLILQPLICPQDQQLKGVAEMAFFAMPNTDTLTFIDACTQFMAEQI